MSSQQSNNIVVIGASAGGIKALDDLFASLKPGVNASIFVVIHLSEFANIQHIIADLQKRCRLEISVPEDGEAIVHEKIYFAPNDQHMMLARDLILIKGGALENRWRPSIDVLFRTAAAAYDSCVTGIILSGLLDDGTSGMLAIKGAGGRCIVQEPEEARYDDMPRNVLANIQVDYRISAHEIPYVLADIFSRSECLPQEVSKQLKQEADITLRMASAVGSTVSLGSPTLMTCPDCGGVLTSISEEGHLRYRCYTGHVFNGDHLDSQYIKRTEETLWVALRMMEERRNFILTMDQNADANKQARVNRQHQRANELKEHIEQLKRLLKALNN